MSVRASSLAQREDARDVGGDVAVADHHGALGRQVELELAVVGVAVVPGDELGGRPAAGQVLAGDAERLVGLRAGRVDDRRVVLHQLGVRDVDARPRRCRRTGSRARSVCRSNVSSRRLISWWSGATPPRSSPHGVGSRSKRSISASPRARSRHGGGERAGGPGADDRHAAARAGHHAAVRSAVPASAKNSRVEVERVVVLRGQLEVGEDRVDRARLDAGVAVDADLGVDVELLGGLEVGRPRLRVDAVHRADLDAGVVLDAAADDDVGHRTDPTNSRNPSVFQSYCLSAVASTHESGTHPPVNPMTRGDPGPRRRNFTVLSSRL